MPFALSNDSLDGHEKNPISRQATLPSHSTGEASSTQSLARFINSISSEKIHGVER